MQDIQDTGYFHIFHTYHIHIDSYRDALFNDADASYHACLRARDLYLQPDGSSVKNG